MLTGPLLLLLLLLPLPFAPHSSVRQSDLKIDAQSVQDEGKAAEFEKITAEVKGLKDKIASLVQSISGDSNTIISDADKLKAAIPASISTKQDANRSPSPAASNVPLKGKVPAAPLKSRSSANPVITYNKSNEPAKLPDVTKVSEQSNSVKTPVTQTIDQLQVSFRRTSCIDR